MFLDPFSNSKVEIESAFIRKAPTEEKMFVVADPHSGIFVPGEALENINLEGESLRISPERAASYVYELTDIGGVVISSLINRAVVDVNRDRSAGGDHGVLPRIAYSGEELLLRPYSDREREEMLVAFFDPFYAAIKEHMHALREQKGKALLLNGHFFIPGTPNTRKHLEDMPRPSFCIGTNKGASVEAALLNVFREALMENAKALPGATVEIDFPYAGDRGLTSEFGRPDEGYNAILLEINRGLYNRESNLPARTEMLSVIKGVVSATVEQTLPYLR
jgi:N-formylglutamate amidohydrolase